MHANFSVLPSDEVNAVVVVVIIIISMTTTGEFNHKNSLCRVVHAKRSGNSEDQGIKA